MASYAHVSELGVDIFVSRVDVVLDFIEESTRMNLFRLCFLEEPNRLITV